MSFSRTLFDESECRQGRLDIHSSTCLDVLSRVQRGALNANPLRSESVQLVAVKAININASASTCRPRPWATCASISSARALALRAIAGCIRQAWAA